MSQDYEIMFNNLIARLKSKKQLHIPLVEKAYNFAKEKHTGQLRKDGGDYISHPVAVACIIEKLDFDSNVISAALLHDVIEDCNISKEQLILEFNKDIAEIVEAVSNISSVGLEKYEAEIKTYQKLVSLGKNNKFAFYIKFADRLHNLSTISSFPRHKQIEKVKQTKRFILPLAKIFRSQYFYRELKNYCYKILNYESEDNFELYYQRNIDFNTPFSNMLKIQLQASLLKLSNKKIAFKKIECEAMKECEIIEILEKKYNWDKNKPSPAVIFKPTCFIYYLIFEGGNFQSRITLLQNHVFANMFRIIDNSIDEFGFNYVIIQDNSRIKYRLYLLDTEEWLRLRNGTTDGVELNIAEEEFEKEIVGEYINVKTRSNEIIRLPKNSTVLDFAFKIHKDFGFSCKYALLNDSNAKTPIFQKLEDGDKVSLIIEQHEGVCTNIATLRWLTYVNNDSSKKILLKFFEKLYE